MDESPGPWSLELTRASLRCGTLTAEIDVARPQVGLHGLRFDGVALSGAIGAVQWTAGADEQSTEWPTKVSDAYVRGRDLIASYERLPNWPFAPQIYWRIEDGPALANFSMLVSIQTDSLDTHPCVRVTTRLPADEMIRVEETAGNSPRRVLDTELAAESFRLGTRNGESSTGSSKTSCAPLPAACILWRLPGGQLSYAEIVPANDFRSLSVTHDESGLTCVHWDLFAEFLEKGVIRRARIESLLLPRENDIELATFYCQSLDRRPLPLTT